MAKTKEAGNTFEPGRDCLARIISARWSSLPTVGPSDFNLVVQVKLSVLCYLGERDPEFVGREAVVFLPVVKQRTIYRPTTEVGEQFARDISLRIVVEESNGRLDHDDQTIVCKFAREDPIHRFQSIDWWRLATREESARFMNKAMKSSGRRPPAFGLTFPCAFVAFHKDQEIKFGKVKVSYFILKRLAQRYPDYYPSRELTAAWTDCGRAVPSEFEISVSTAVSKLRDLLEPKGLTVERNTGEGYRLAEFNPD